MDDINIDYICGDISKWKQNGFAVNVYCSCLNDSDVFCKRCGTWTIDFYKKQNSYPLFMILKIKKLSCDHVKFIHPVSGAGNAFLDNQLSIRGRYLNEKLVKYDDLINFLRNDFTSEISDDVNIDSLLDTYLFHLSRFEFIKNLFGNTQKDEEIIIEI